MIGLTTAIFDIDVARGGGMDCELDGVI